MIGTVCQIPVTACFELSEFPEALFFWASRNSVTSISRNWAFGSSVPQIARRDMIGTVCQIPVTACFELSEFPEALLTINPVSIIWETSSFEWSKMWGRISTTKNATKNATQNAALHREDRSHRRQTVDFPRSGDRS
jgi:hypothetical protein